jgi:thioredoxin:protein disulfide reductase
MSVKTSIIIAGVFGCLLSCATIPPLPETAAPEWHRDERQALAQSKATGRPLIIDFYAEWCSSCMELDHETYSDPRVRKVISAKFVALKVDCTEDSPEIKAIEKKYGVTMLPTVLFVDPSGHTLDSPRVSEFEMPDLFLADLAKVR